MNLRIGCAAALLLAACGGANEVGGADSTMASSDNSTTTTATTSPQPGSSSTRPATSGSGESTTSSTTTATTTAPSTTAAASTTTMQDGDLTPPSLIQAIIADLASREGVGAGEIELVSAESVQWPDGSLGCPVAGVSYIQVVTPGYRVILGIGEVTFDYRATVDGSLRLCENPLAGSSSPNPES